MSHAEIPDQHAENDEPTDTSSPLVKEPLLRETAEADAEDPTIGGSSDGDTAS